MDEFDTEEQDSVITDVTIWDKVYSVEKIYIKRFRKPPKKWNVRGKRILVWDDKSELWCMFFNGERFITNLVIANMIKRVYPSADISLIIKKRRKWGIGKVLSVKNITYESMIQDSEIQDWSW